MNKTIAFIGFGELGIQIYNILLESNISFSSIIVFDDKVHQDNKYIFIDKVYPFKNYKNTKFSECNFVVALGYRHLELKHKIIQELQHNNSILPNIIHKSSFVSRTAKLGQGNIIYPMCNIDIMVKIGDGNIFNNSSVISHDNEIGNANFFAPGFISSGKITIGNYNFFGAGSILSNGLDIQNKNIIGIGSVITKNIDSNSSYIGNPMIKLSKNITLK